MALREIIRDFRTAADRHRPKRMQQRFTEWLSRGAVAVPEVTAAAASFRSNGHAGRSAG